MNKRIPKPLRGQQKNIVDDYRIGMARMVIAGQFGDGKFRRDALARLGYSPREIHEIQLTVNWMTDLRLR